MENICTAPNKPQSQPHHDGHETARRATHGLICFRAILDRIPEQERDHELARDIGDVLGILVEHCHGTIVAEMKPRHQ